MYRIGVDLGGTNISVGVVDGSNKIIGTGKVKTNAGRSAEAVFEDIAKAIKLAVEDAKISLSEIKSIGLGTPGSVDKVARIIVYSNNLNFYNVDAGKLLGKYFDAPVYLDNDANCAALGEAVAGAGYGKKSFIAVTLGTGVGSGIIFEGKILTGCNYNGAECGHMVIVADGEECTCGRKGCWESYASATALIRQTKAAMENDKETVMWSLVGGDINKVSGRTAFDGMRKGDKTAKKVVDTYIDYIALGTTNLINIFQPEMICFGGGICNEGDTLLNPIREYIKRERYSKYARTQTEICRAILGNDAGVIGAALLDE